MKAKIVFLISCLLSALFYLAWWNSSTLAIMDYKFYDYAVAFHRASASESSTVIVEIDEKSLQSLGQWPWPRVVTASLLNKFAPERPSAIALDFIFPEADRTSPASVHNFYSQFFNLQTKFSGLPDALKDNDRILADAMNAQTVILPLYFKTTATMQKECTVSKKFLFPDNNDLSGLYESPYALCNLPLIQEKAKALGHIQAALDEDGILRRLALFFRYQNGLIPTLGLASLTSVDPDIRLTQTDRLTKDIKIRFLNTTFTTDERSDVLLQFYPRQWYRTVSALDVLEGNYPPSLFQGKFVLIGATAMGLHDHYTLGDGSMWPGVFAHATLIENMINQTVLTQPKIYKIINISLSAVFALILMTLMFKKRYISMIILFLTAGTLGLVGSYLLLQENIYISMGYFIVPLIAYVFVLAMILFVIHYRERKRFYEEMSKANTAMLDSMALVAETRDTDTGAHIIRTKEYVRLLANSLASQGIYKDVLTQEYIVNLYYAAPLHDIGKVGIPDNILKKEDRLSTDEYTVMKTHSVLGKEIIGNAIHAYHDTKMLTIAYNIAYYHHEKWDGSGYPVGLKGEEIPLEARLMALADVYDAIISRRCYKPPFTFENAEEIILQGRGIHFDPLLVDTFFLIKEEFKRIAEQNRNN